MYCPKAAQNIWVLCRIAHFCDFQPTHIFLISLFLELNQFLFLDTRTHRTVSPLSLESSRATVNQCHIYFQTYLNIPCIWPYYIFQYHNEMFYIQYYVFIPSLRKSYMYFEYARQCTSDLMQMRNIQRFCDIYIYHILLG